MYTVCDRCGLELHRRGYARHRGSLVCDVRSRAKALVDVGYDPVPLQLVPLLPSTVTCLSDGTYDERVIASMRRMAKRYGHWPTCFLRFWAPRRLIELLHQFLVEFDLGGRKMTWGRARWVRRMIVPFLLEHDRLPTRTEFLALLGWASLESELS